MVFKNEIITYLKKDNKLFQLITREIDLNSLNDDIRELENVKTEKDAKIQELNDLKKLT